jgi:hypothetical protein
MTACRKLRWCALRRAALATPCLKWLKEIVQRVQKLQRRGHRQTQAAWLFQGPTFLLLETKVGSTPKKKVSISILFERLQKQFICKNFTPRLPHILHHGYHICKKLRADVFKTEMSSDISVRTKATSFPRHLSVLYFLVAPAHVYLTRPTSRITILTHWQSVFIPPICSIQERLSD